MKTAKITEITKVNEWNKWPYWTLYYIYMKLDNWETINLCKKKADAFKVGDTVSYNTIEEWKKYEEVKESWLKKSYNSESNNKGAMIWMAIKTAFELLYDKKEQNFNECIALAHRIYEEWMAMFNETEKPEEKSDEVDLPF